VLHVRLADLHAAHQNLPPAIRTLRLKETVWQGNGEYCIVVGWDAEAAAMRFRGFRGRPESRGCTVRCRMVGRSILTA